jgi:hypothetical protein
MEWLEAGRSSQRDTSEKKGGEPGKRQEEFAMKVKKVEKVKASGWIWGGGGG